MSIVAAMGLTAFAALPAKSETQSFEERVRAYLLANPEVILEALEILAEREARVALEAKIAAFPELFSDPPRHGLGDPGAAIRVIEFFDYKCGPCKAMHPGLERLVAENPDLRIEMRQLPILSPASEQAARFALAVRAVAGDAAYARVHERLWMMRGPMNTAGFHRIAEAEGLDFDLIAREMHSDAVTARIDRNRDIAIALELVGTPAFVSPSSVNLGQSDIAGLAAAWLSR